MPPDFLNSREDAILFWALVFAGWLLSNDARGIIAAVFQVVRAALHPKLVHVPMALCVMMPAVAALAWGWVG